MVQALEAAPAGHYRVKHVVRSEVAKIMTLPSTAIILGITAIAVLLVTTLVAHSALHQNPGWYNGFDPTQEALTGMVIAGLAGGVLGALLITSEYASGTVRTSLAAVPRRPLLAATKMGVTTALMLVYCELLSFASFLLGEGILSSGGAPHASLSSPGALRAVWMTGAFIALLALMSFGFGLIFRHTAAAIAAFVGVVFVLPLFMHQISQSDVRYLPTNILVNSVMATVNQGPQGVRGPVSAVLGLVLMAVYAAITLVVGAVLFSRRDA